MFFFFIKLKWIIYANYIPIREFSLQSKIRTPLTKYVLHHLNHKKSVHLANSTVRPPQHHLLIQTHKCPQTQFWYDQKMKIEKKHTQKIVHTRDLSSPPPRKMCVYEWINGLCPPTLLCCSGPRVPLRVLHSRSRCTLLHVIRYYWLVDVLCVAKPAISLLWHSSSSLFFQ